MKNVVSSSEGGYRLKIHIEGIAKGYEDIIAAPQMERVSLPTLFIKGEKSGYIQEEDEATIAQWFDHYEIREVSGAGHWVHAENREGFIAALMSFLDE